MTSLQGFIFFVAMFLQVFLLGFQSRNVNSEKYISAAITSLLIGGTQLICIKSIADYNPSTVFLITAIAGPTGIMSSMFLHKIIFDRRK